MTTSFLEVIAHDDDNSTHKLHQATTIAKIRAGEIYSTWFDASTSAEDRNLRIAHVETDIRGIAHVTAEEFGVAAEPIADALVASFRPTPTERTASVHESRKPRMCPFHKDVVDISLAQGEPKAGFEAMAQHWGGDNHCQGEGYKGESCKFKPQMTTQSFWDEKSEKAEERKQQRLEDEQAQAEAPQNEEVPQEAEQTDSTEPVADAVDNTSEGEGAEVIDFPVQDSAEAPAEAPMAMAAGTEHDAYSGPANMPAGANPQADFVQQAIRLVEYYRSIGDEQSARHYEQIVQQAQGQQAGGGGLPLAASTKTADDGLGGKGTASPTMNKKRWTPGSPKVELEGEDSRWPTRRKDIVDVDRPNNETSRPATEIGENKTERVNVTEGTGPAATDQGGTWSGGVPSAVTAAIPHDVDVNPIKALMAGEYDGFLPERDVQQAIAAHRGK